MNNYFSSSTLTVILATVAILTFVISYLLSRKNSRQSSGHDKFEELYQKIHEDIKYAVAPKSIQLSTGASELIKFATEIWHIEQRLLKVSDVLPENQRKGLENSVRKLKAYISKYDVEIVDYTGKKFNDGLNLNVLSVEKDPSVTTPTIKETIEPTILVKGQVVKKAKIILISN